MFIKIVAALAITLLLMLVFWLLRGAMLTPVRLGKNQHLSLVLTVSGPSPELENTVDALLWLIQNGTLRGQIVLRDAGMDADTRQAAELLDRQGIIKLIH